MCTSIPGVAIAVSFVAILPSSLALVDVGHCLKLYYILERYFFLHKFFNPLYFADLKRQNKPHISRATASDVKGSFSVRRIATTGQPSLLKKEIQ